MDHQNPVACGFNPVVFSPEFFMPLHTLDMFHKATIEYKQGMRCTPFYRTHNANDQACAKTAAPMWGLQLPSLDFDNIHTVVAGQTAYKVFLQVRDTLTMNTLQTNINNLVVDISTYPDCAVDKAYDEMIGNNVDTMRRRVYVAWLSDDPNATEWLRRTTLDPHWQHLMHPVPMQPQYFSNLNSFVNWCTVEEARTGGHRSLQNSVSVVVPPGEDLSATNYKGRELHFANIHATVCPDAAPEALVSALTPHTIQRLQLFFSTFADFQRFAAETTVASLRADELHVQIAGDVPVDHLVSDMKVSPLHNIHDLKHIHVYTIKQPTESVQTLLDNGVSVRDDAGTTRFMFKKTPRSTNLIDAQTDSVRSMDVDDDCRTVSSWDDLFRLAMEQPTKVPLCGKLRYTSDVSEMNFDKLPGINWKRIHLHYEAPPSRTFINWMIKNKSKETDTSFKNSILRQQWNDAFNGIFPEDATSVPLTLDRPTVPPPTNKDQNITGLLPNNRGIDEITLPTARDENSDGPNCTRLTIAQLVAQKSTQRCIKLTVDNTTVIPDNIEAQNWERLELDVNSEPPPNFLDWLKRNKVEHLNLNFTTAELARQFLEQWKLPEEVSMDIKVTFGDRSYKPMSFTEYKNKVMPTWTRPHITPNDIIFSQQATNPVTLFNPNWESTARGGTLKPIDESHTKLLKKSTHTRPPSSFTKHANLHSPYARNSDSRFSA